MSSLRPAPTPQSRATAGRDRKIPAIKVIVTILSAIIMLFLANTLRSGSDDSATNLSTQSLLSFPVGQADVATTPPLVPTTPPLVVPTPTPSAAPTSTAVPLPDPTATAAPTPTEAPAAAVAPAEPAPEPAAETLSLTSQAEPEPAAPAAPLDLTQAEAAQPEPTAIPIPTETPVEVVPTPEPTATPLPVVEAPVEETPTATPEPTPTPTPEPVNIYDLELYVLGEINQVRANAGLPPVQLHDSISLVSRDWSTQMATGAFFEHRPGSQLNVMMPSGWLRWGENIASAPDIKYAQDSLEASPGHYENMVGDYTHVGIGVYSTVGQVWVTQNFGKY